MLPNVAVHLLFYSNTFSYNRGGAIISGSHLHFSNSAGDSNTLVTCTSVVDAINPYSFPHASIGGSSIVSGGSNGGNCGTGCGSKSGISCVITGSELPNIIGGRDMGFDTAVGTAGASWRRGMSSSASSLLKHLSRCHSAISSAVMVR